MILRALRALNRTQQTRTFKVVASIVVVVASLAGFIAYSVAKQRIRDDALAPLSAMERQLLEEREAAAKAEASRTDSKSPVTEVQARQRPDDAMDASLRVFKGVVRAQHSVASVGMGFAIGAGLLLVVIWMGLGLTYLALGVVCALVLLVAGSLGVAKQWAPISVGVVALAASFFAITRLLSLLLSGPGAVFAIARTVLMEAVRLKVPIVFIVLLLFSLAALPLVLDDTTPLRYRVQAFMQYATGGAFWLIAILTILFSITTVAFEQRDKQIWQTMTKPVAPWRYILGKWLGVAALTLALLTTSCAGVFLFVEYLRRQPAQGETIAFKPTDDRLITQDRLILETQVLTARRIVKPDPPEVNPEALERAINERIEQEIAQMGELAADPKLARERRQGVEKLIRESLTKNVVAAYRTIEPAQSRVFVFNGLRDAKRHDTPVILRYKINSGGNMPDQLYRIGLYFPLAGAHRIMETPLDQTMTVELMPAVVGEDGAIVLEIVNGDPEQQTANPLSITFPPDNLEVSYSTGSFQANFVRLAAVLWLKLLFLSMLAITASTFLSFPVASLVSFASFLAAESARYLLSTIDYYETETMQGETLYFNTAVAKLTQLIGNIFAMYADLRPTGRLVEGLYLSWGGLLGGVAFLGLFTSGLYAVAVFIFRRRELATYSGQ